MHGTVDQVVDLEEEHAVMLSFGVPADVLREVTRERDEARDLLRQVAVALGCPDQAPGDLPSSVEALRLQRDRLEKTCAMPGDRLLADALEARNQAIRERDQARLDAQTQASPVVMRCEVDGRVIEVRARTVTEATEAAQAIGMIGMIAMPAPDAPQKRDDASAKGSLVGRYFDRAVRAELACASLEAERDEARERAAALEAAVERVRPVVEALASVYEAEATNKGEPRLPLATLMRGLGRRLTPYADDAAWLRSLIPATQDDR